MTFEEIVKADLKIDAIVEHDAVAILRKAGALRGLPQGARLAVRDAIVGNIETARAIVIAYRSYQAGKVLKV